MKKMTLIILTLFVSSNLYSQCNWSSFFPFKAGNSKFDIAKIRSGNSTIADMEDEHGLNYIFDKHNNGFQKFEYLKDSVYINVINLRFVNNDCFKGSKNHIQVSLSDDKLHKGSVELNYDDYNSMEKQYEELLELVPVAYRYKEPFEVFNSKTNQKTGEGIRHAMKPHSNEGDKLHNIRISYSFNFKMVYDKKERESYFTNEIDDYTIKIEFTDLRQSKLTGEGY